MKIRKRLISAIMAVVACMTFVSMSAYAADGSISAKASVDTVAVAETFTVDVSIDSNPGITFFKAWVEYSDGLQLTGATDAKLLNTPLLDSNYPNPYAITWADGLATDNNTATGKLVTLTFAVKEGATGTQSVTITSEPESCNDVDFEELDFGSATASVTVKSAEKAEPTVVENTKDSDADANGNVTKGYLVSATVSAETKAINGITVTAASNGKTKSVPYTFTTVTDGTVKVAVNVLNVPSTATVDFSYALSTVAE